MQVICRTLIHTVQWTAAAVKRSCTGATMEENMDYKNMCLDIINRMDDTQLLRKVYYLLVGMCGSNSK